MRHITPTIKVFREKFFGFVRAGFLDEGLKREVEREIRSFQDGLQVRLQDRSRRL